MTQAGRFHLYENSRSFSIPDSLRRSRSPPRPLLVDTLRRRRRLAVQAAVRARLGLPDGNRTSLQVLDGGAGPHDGILRQVLASRARFWCNVATDFNFRAR